MKKLIYKIEGYIGVYNPDTEEVEQRLSLAEVIVKNPSEEAIAKAKETAHNGEYEIIEGVDIAELR